MAPWDPARPAIPGPDPAPDETRQALARGIAAFNERRFFECHDILEELWLETRGRDRLFLQGLIQVAVGFHHLGNANRAGAESQLARGLDKLADYEDGHGGIALGALREEVAGWLERVRAGAVPPFDPEALPRIRPAGELS